jgi:integrase
MAVKIKKYKGSWYVFIHYHGQRKAKKIGTRQAAEKVKREIEARLALGDLSCLGKVTPVPTFSAYADRWLETDAPTRCKTSTIDFYKDYQKRYALPQFGSTELTAITRDAIKDFIAHLSGRGLAKNTIRLAVASLRVVLSAAVEDGILASNPAVRLGQFVKTDKPEQEALAMQPEEAEQFLATVHEQCPEYFPLFLIALRAGLRQGEILGLKWGDFQFGESEDDMDRYIFVQRRWYRGRFGTTKGGKGRRVDMSRELRRVLIEMFDRRLLEAHQQGKTSIADELVFPGDDGNPLRARKLLESYFVPMLERASLRHFRFHDLRHTFGSLLMEAGAPLPYVRDQMGHSSIQMTADKYVHLVPRRNVHFIDRLDSLTSPQPDATQAQPERKCRERESTQSKRQIIDKKAWCERGDSNPHPLRDQILSLARLPIPPLSQSR